MAENSGGGQDAGNWINDATPYLTATATDDQSNFTGKWSGKLFSPEEVEAGDHTTKMPDDTLELTTDTTPTVDVASDTSFEGDTLNLYDAGTQTS